MYKGEQGYLDLLKHIRYNGQDRGDRTGTGTRSIFSAQLEFDLTERFPLLTTKKMAVNGIIGELLWMLSGNTDLATLRWFTHGDANSDKKTIWDANIEDWTTKYSLPEGQGGNLYGAQWRSFIGVDDTYCDQVQELVDTAKADPESRRLLVSAWNAAEIKAELMALPSCHFAWQVYIEDGYLDFKWNQRSADTLLGIPYNIASYAALAHILAQWLGLKPRRLVGDLTNVHIYHNHFEAVDEQLARMIVPCNPALIVPEGLELHNIDEYTAADFVVVGYKSHQAIKAPMAV